MPRSRGNLARWGRLRPQALDPAAEMIHRETLRLTQKRTSDNFGLTCAQ